ncbi:glycosyl hydrolase 115 family protein [Paraflavitalea sp. CAU 1676]|uniref:glycosyl hydrolase 115 family protein n=1 Tax=Paraflavitalea sp. CAU 1676 TaxID=3032598 RepID=UPI0023D9DFEB|nr:glycosyl hydrolase 115 family protein [Paraflavitalea sp. CAU 1676]MDF2192286.1 glycosyl hydrolase 115 family protein [Paraflavitalea sp. CAU 1676]
MKKLILLLWLTAAAMVPAFTQNFITGKPVANSFPIADSKSITAIYVDINDDELVQKAATLLCDDIERVTSRRPSLINTLPASAAQLIVIGSLGKSTIIQQLTASQQIKTSDLSGKWEAYRWQLIKTPAPGIRRALVITGSDRRGAAYGTLELSKQIGVSPWYWWADVPVQKRSTLYLTNTNYSANAPAIKYRGIFINDEAPALSGWSKEKFGGFNHQFYEKVFELMLRLKANYLWPAMWGNAFYDDDSLNIKMADTYGIVIGTSHHEPLMRAHDEWRRYGTGKWNYDSNQVRLQQFWRTGMQRATNEKIVSVGMRGDGDEPMSRETATALLERIVKEQRNIIEEVTQQPASETPQLWALYKEVQDYYDKGMRVPDDVTLLLCDDNWGNIRRLPKPDENPRKGGYGIYYHFDYVGGPRNYKWINTNAISRVWEQMHLAWEYKAREIWIVNVGDIKPMEFPISFFLDYAWDPTAIGPADLQRYTEKWAAQQFGATQAKSIADIISKYTKYNSRRKPELLDANTYHFDHYDEAGRVTRAYDELLKKATQINQQLPARYRDAYFQLVLHPVKASSNLYNLYHAIAENNKAHRNQNHSLVARTAKEADQYYLQDSLITREYHTLHHAKWNHMMSQTHIGYTYWQQPPFNNMPAVYRVDPDNSTFSSSILPAATTHKEHSNTTFHAPDDYVSIEAAHYTKAVNAHGITWTVLPDHGKTGDAVTTFPVTASIQQLTTNSPHLQYEFKTTINGPATVNAYFSPTLNIQNAPEGLQYAISIDDETPQVISLNKEDSNVRTWEQWVANNIIIKTSTHKTLQPGKHVLKYWMVSPAVVLQKLVIDLGGAKESYLGPPETRR